MVLWRYREIELPFGSLISGADASLPSQASTDGAASMAYGRPRDANAVDSCPAHAASNSYLRHHIVRGSKRCRRHSLCRRCDCQREACNSDQLEHCSPPIAVPVNLLSAYPPSGLRLAIDQGRVTGPTVLAHGRRKSARKSRSACSPVIVPGHMPVRTMAIGAIVPCTHLP
jgi:hypothetical protein